MARPLALLRREYAELISKLTVDDLADLWSDIDSATIARMIQAAESVLRERNPDPTGFTPPRFAGDDEPAKGGA